MTISFQDFPFYLFLKILIVENLYSSLLYIHSFDAILIARIYLYCMASQEKKLNKIIMNHINHFDNNRFSKRSI